MLVVGPDKPEVRWVDTGGTKVELLVWGERGLPGLFLLHGAGAHAHWWDAVAPLLAHQYRVAAMKLPGNGASEWRERYSSVSFFEDVRACVAAAALADAGKPVFVGHSMGGAHLMHGAVHSPDSMRGLVLVDTSFRSPGAGTPPAVEPTRRMFASEAEALNRFRLMPPGPAREPALVEHVARHALMSIVGPEGETGWCWRGDPAYWHKFERGTGIQPRAGRTQPGGREGAGGGDPEQRADGSGRSDHTPCNAAAERDAAKKQTEGFELAAWLVRALRSRRRRSSAPASELPITRSGTNLVSSPALRFIQGFIGALQ